jgi:DNA polymerase-3 subunit gamma/tau
MLSKSAWNAFLKTLEEPPAHAVFILATTEPERVPETVQSRCQVFEFKKPTRKDLARMVAGVAKKEGYELAPDAAELVAILAEGSYRDALSVLQRVLAAAGGKELTREEVERATGAPKRELVHGLLAALAAGDRGASLAALERAASSGADMRLFLELVLESLRAALLIRYAPELRESFAEELGADEFAALEKFAKEQGITHRTLLAFLAAAERIRYAPIPALPLELAVLELFPG